MNGEDGCDNTSLLWTLLLLLLLLVIETGDASFGFGILFSPPLRSSVMLKVTGGRRNYEERGTVKDQK